MMDANLVLQIEVRQSLLVAQSSHMGVCSKHYSTMIGGDCQPHGHFQKRESQLPSLKY